MQSHDMQTAAERLQSAVGRLEFLIRESRDTIGDARADGLLRTADNVSRWIREATCWSELEGASIGLHTFAAVVCGECGK